jgi:hypothetical protein
VSQPSSTRKLIINARCLAMTGDLKSALTLLDELPSHSTREDVVKAMSAKAELLFLNCREIEAIDIFGNQIEPQLRFLKRETSLIAGYNRNDLAMYAFDFTSGSRSYDLYDRARITGDRLFDAEKTVYAFESAAEGKHYDALPAFWRETLESYRHSSWTYFRRASSRLAQEFLTLGWIDLAAYHAILGLDKEVAKGVANQSLLRQDLQVIELVINKVLKSANLKRHAMIGCLILSEMADAIPDNRIQEVFHWLLQKALVASPTVSEIDLLRGAWDAITSIAHRLSAENAITLVRTATQHEIWMNANLLRKHLIDAVNTAVANLPLAELPTVAERAIPLATTSKHDLDYANSINLLCNIAQTGGNEIRATIGDALYSAEPVQNAILMQVAEIFGRQLASEEHANIIAQRVAVEIGNQVQRGIKDEGAPVEGYGRVTIGSESESITVGLSSLTGLRAVLNHRKLLSDESVNLLANAILGMIIEPENIPANKTALIDCLMTLEDRLTPNAANSLFEALTPIASGIIPEPKIIKAHGDPDNPLNPFKMNLGTFAQIQGQALHAVAYLDELNDGKYADRLDSIFTSVLIDTNAEIRRAGFGALRWLTKLSEPLIMSLLLGTRDPETRTAEAAYVALAKNKHFRIPVSLWHQLIYSLTMASKSPLSQLRRVAAYTIKNLRSQCPSELSTSLRQLEEQLASDICYSVRSPLADALDENESTEAKKEARNKSRVPSKKGSRNVKKKGH